MGFFGKIKQNLNHGGVKVELQAPASASMQDPALPVTVTITNSGSEQHSIKSVTAEIVASSRNQSFGPPDPNNMSRDEVVNQTVARAENSEQFVLQPGETKTVQLSIVLNAGAAVQSQLPEGGALAQAAGAFQKLQSIGEALNNKSYTYAVRGYADVEGIALDPSKDQDIQILKPGEIGGAFNVKL